MHYFLFVVVVFRTSNDQNKELYVDFVAAQIKTLSLLAYVIRIYQVQSVDRIVH